MKIIAVIAEFQFKPDQTDKALNILRDIIAESHKEAGCLYYDLYQDDTKKITI